MISNINTKKFICSHCNLSHLKYKIDDEKIDTIFLTDVCQIGEETTFKYISSHDYYFDKPIDSVDDIRSFPLSFETIVEVINTQIKKECECCEMSEYVQFTLLDKFNNIIEICLYNDENHLIDFKELKQHNELTYNDIEIDKISNINKIKEYLKTNKIQ